MSDDGIPVRDADGIRYLKPYTLENPPQPGDLVWGPWDGEDVHIIGGCAIPADTEILGEDDEVDES